MAFTLPKILSRQYGVSRTEIRELIPEIIQDKREQIIEFRKVKQLKRGFKYGFKPYYKIEERKRRRNIRSLKGEPESKLKKLIIKWFRLQIRIYESVIKTRLNYRQARTYRDQESIDIPAYFGCSDLRENLRQLKS